MYRQAFAGGGQTDLSSPLEFLGSLEGVESESLLTKGGSTNVLDCLTSLEERNEEILNSDDFLVPRQLTIQNDMGIACHPELVSGSRCIKSPLPPFIKGGKNASLPCKGGGTEVPEGLSQVTLTRLGHPIPGVEGEESCHPELVSGSQYKKFSIHYPVNKEGARMLQPINNPVRPLTLALSRRARKIQASLGKGSGTEVPEGFKKRKAAFTLAEVLITLGIIGVVAAMTLPAVVNKYQKLVTSARLKKFYSSMNQAILMAESEHGSSAYWNRINFIADGEGQYKYNEGAVSILNTYILPYVKYLKLDKGSLPVEDSEGNVVQDGEFPTVYFADGTTMQVVIGSCFDIYFDSNGMGKPNTKGVDQFIFYFCYGNNRKKTTFSSLIPEEDASTYEPRAEALRICKIIPDRCSILLEKYDNFEFKEDYPW